MISMVEKVMKKNVWKRAKFTRSKDPSPPPKKKDSRQTPTFKPTYFQKPNFFDVNLPPESHFLFLNPLFAIKLSFFVGRYSSCLKGNLIARRSLLRKTFNASP